MNLRNQFNDIAERYGVNYQWQNFKDGSYAHSLYNESGCFTILCLPARGEIDCYYSKEFSNDKQRLCAKQINIYEVEKDIWERNKRKWIFKIPFQFWGHDRTIRTIIEVIQASVNKTNIFYGIEIK